MGILNRFTDIMRGNINSALDKLEDPSKQIDLLLIDSKRDLAEVKKETAGVMAARQQAQRLYDKEKADVDKYTAAAKAALAAGDEEAAIKIAERIVSEQQEADQAKTVLTMAASNEKKMKDMYDKLCRDIASLEGKRNNLKGLAAATKAQQTVNKAVGRTSKGVGTKLNDYETRINSAFDKATAEAELNAGPAPDEADLLAAKYSGSKSATDLVASLRSELGLGFSDDDLASLGNGPKPQSSDDVLRALKEGLDNV